MRSGMDVCDLTGTEPNWATQQTTPSSQQQHSIEDTQQLNRHTRGMASQGQPYRPLQQPQQCLPPQPLQPTGYRAIGLDASSQGHQQQQAGCLNSNNAYDSTDSSTHPSHGSYRQPSPSSLSGAASGGANGYSSNKPPYNSQPASPQLEGGSWGDTNGYPIQQPGRGSAWSDSSRGYSGGRSPGRAAHNHSYRSAPHNAAEAGSWGSTRSDSALDRYQGGDKQWGGFGYRLQHHGGSYGNFRSDSPSCGNNRVYSNTGYQGYNSGNGNSGPWGGGRYGGGRYNSGYNTSGSAGYRSNGGSRPGSAGQGSATPPCWTKQGCWLVPRPGSSHEAGYKAALADISNASQALQQQVVDLTADGVTVAADGVEVASAVIASSAVSDSTAAGEKLVVILRGLPGSGKSTRAAQIVAEAAAAIGTEAAVTATVGATEVVIGTAVTSIDVQCTAQTPAARAAPAAVIHSTDSYFIDPATGAYTFNLELLSINHQKNYDAFCASLAAGVGTVIVDNTNIQPWQFEKYVTAAWAAGYKVKEEIIGQFTEEAVALYANRNVHGVPYDKLLMMLDQWRRQ